MTKQLSLEDAMLEFDEIRIHNLNARFDYLTKGMDDWKMPITATIPVAHLNEYRDACAYFTGTELYQTYCNGDGTMKVAAKGYYMMGE